MTDDNRFFRWVWRFNALLVAAASCAYIANFAYTNSYWFQHPESSVPELEPSGLYKPVASSQSLPGKYDIGNSDPEVVGNTQLFVLVHHSGPEIEATNGAFSGEAGLQTVNILAVDAETKQSRWLFKGRNRWIVFKRPFSETATAGAPADAMAFEVIEEDTNKDGKVMPNDRHVFYVYSSSRHELIKLVTADSFRDIQRVGSDKLMITCYNGDKGSAVTFSLPDYKLLATIDLPVLPD